MNAHSFAALVATARRVAQMDAAEFDYALAFGPAAGNYRAYEAFDMARGVLASERYTAADARHAQYCEQLRVLHADAIAAMGNAAVRKSYIGWSTASTGPIQYA